MELSPIGIEGAWLAESPVWSDERGFFREWFKNEDVKAATGIDFSIQQANISKNFRGALRGIHYSLAPYGQAKWVTCSQGSILDVVVDIRPSSPTFKSYRVLNLNGSDGRALLIGAGLGHAFAAMEDNSLVTYLLSSKFDPEHEHSINLFDKELNLPWEEWIGHCNFLVSQKDANSYPLLEMQKRNLLPK